MSMEVVSARSALLSNYEVFTLLKELESEQLARQKTAIRVKKEEEERVALGMIEPAASVQASMLLQEEVCENLRTVEFEAIQYLTAEYQPTKLQSQESIENLIKEINGFDLTKAEKLQIVNMAPTEPVELYVIVEEIEDRLGDSMDDVLSAVRASLSTPTTINLAASDVPTENLGVQAIDSEMYEGRSGWAEGEGVEEEFDDYGAGVGIEGDLEMGDDD